MSRQSDWFMQQVTWLPYNPVLGTREVCDVAPPEKDYSIDLWRAEVGAYFPDLLQAAETCLSVVCQLLIQDVRNPFALILVDRPSSGKTIVINFFDEIEGITHAVDHFTVASFVSNIAGRSKAQLEKIDLLPRIRFKTLLIREMATMLSEDENDLRERLGMLTRILDGRGFKTESGVYGERGYTGDYLFMMLGASTPFPLRVWKAMTGFGHRLFFYNINSPVLTAKDLVGQTRATSYAVKEELCRRATNLLVRTIWTNWKDGAAWDMEKDDPVVHDCIADLSVFLAKFRGDIVIFKEWTEDGKEITGTRPEFETPSRINACLNNLARGHAIASGRNYVTMADFGVVLRTVLSTAPEPRPTLLRALLRHGGKMAVEEVMKALDCSRNTAKKEMFKFLRLGICKGEVEQGEKEESDGDLVSFGQKKTWIEISDEFGWWKQERMVGILEAEGLIT